MRRNARMWIGVLAVAACAIGVATLLSSPVSAAPQGQPCGGILGTACPDGYVCVDLPGDGCDPQHGGSDCAGYCKRGR